MEKRKPRLTALLLALLALLGLAGAFLLGTRFPAPKRSGDARLRYAAGRVLCIGDSLTSGTCFGSGLGGAETEQRYAYYLGRMLSAEVDVAAVPGYSASDWYPRFADELDFSASGSAPTTARWTRSRRTCCPMPIRRTMRRRRQAGTAA